MYRRTLSLLWHWSCLTKRHNTVQCNAASPPPGCTGWGRGKLSGCQQGSWRSPGFPSGGGPWWWCELTLRHQRHTHISWYGFRTNFCSVRSMKLAPRCYMVDKYTVYCHGNLCTGINYTERLIKCENRLLNGAQSVGKFWSKASAICT